MQNASSGVAVSGTGLGTWRRPGESRNPRKRKLQSAICSLTPPASSDVDVSFRMWTLGSLGACVLCFYKVREVQGGGGVIGILRARLPLWNMKSI
jgi:hypothetical protein